MREGGQISSRVPCVSLPRLNACCLHSAESQTPHRILQKKPRTHAKAATAVGEQGAGAATDEVIETYLFLTSTPPHFSPRALHCCANNDSMTPGRINYLDDVMLPKVLAQGNMY